MSASAIAAVSLAAIIIQLLCSIIIVSLLLYSRHKRTVTNAQNIDARSSISSYQSQFSVPPSDEERNIEAAECREHPLQDTRTWTRDGARNPVPSTSASDESSERTRIIKYEDTIPGPLSNHVNRNSPIPRFPSPDLEEPSPTPSLAQNFNHRPSPPNSLTKSSSPTSPPISPVSSPHICMALAPRSPVPRRIPTTEEVAKDIQEMFEDTRRQSQLLGDQHRAIMIEEEKRKNQAIQEEEEEEEEKDRTKKGVVEEGVVD